jgi:hypothetical protein
MAVLAKAGWFPGGRFEPGAQTRDFIGCWQCAERPTTGPGDLPGALAALCASRRRAAVAPPLPRAPAEGRRHG